MVVVVALAAFLYGLVHAAARWTAPLSPAASVRLDPRSLPLYAGLSTLRMGFAYVLSLVFSLVYARIAVTNRGAERIMIPVLDILQSIPILSFLPGVVLALVALFPHSNIGLELSAILLIFTSQAWNMAFSFHQSLLTLPAELSEAAAVYRLTWWRRFALLELPFGTIPLIWNSMMSWAGGWFFLMAAEQFTLGRHSFQLAGLGSYLQSAANAGSGGDLALGLATLITVIVLLDQLLWRPLLAWADRFKFEQSEGAGAPDSPVLRALRRSALLAWLERSLLAPLAGSADRWLSRLNRPDAGEARDQRQPHAAGRAVRGVALAGLLVACVAIVAAVAMYLSRLTAANWGDVVLSTAATLLRTTLALLIGLAWTVPVGVAIGMNPRWARAAQPLVQMAASVPATALFPAMLLLLIGLPGGLNIAAVGLMLLGTQWYILFNVIAGATAIPSELREVGLIYHLHGWSRWRRLILPAIFPSLVTGMITATGGAWNASIVSEFVMFNHHVYSTVGLGALIASSANAGNFPLLLAATLAMAAVVVGINRVLWHRLTGLAERRFHY